MLHFSYYAIFVIFPLFYFSKNQFFCTEAVQLEHCKCCQNDFGIGAQEQLVSFGTEHILPSPPWCGPCDNYFEKTLDYLTIFSLVNQARTLKVSYLTFQRFLSIGWQLSILVLLFLSSEHTYLVVLSLYWYRKQHESSEYKLFPMFYSS